MFEAIGSRYYERLEHRKLPKHKKFVCCLLALALVSSLLPVKVYIFSMLWKDYSREVNKGLCSCSCWDTIFKGPYEKGVSTYKHFYFNATTNALKIWLLLVAFIVAIYESTKYMMRLALSGSLRYEMLVLFVCSLFSNYYAWWAMTNYYNDEFYAQWDHQMFFTVSELISTLLVLHLANKRAVISLLSVAVVSCIATLHIVAASKDQFVTNVIFGRGQLHQVLRDLMLMVPDVLLAAVPPASYLHQLCTSRLKHSKPKSFLQSSFVFIVFLCAYTVSYFVLFRND